MRVQEVEENENESWTAEHLQSKQSVKLLIRNNRYPYACYAVSSSVVTGYFIFPLGINKVSIYRIHSSNCIHELLTFIDLTSCAHAYCCLPKGLFNPSTSLFICKYISVKYPSLCSWEQQNSELEGTAL